MCRWWLSDHMMVLVIVIWMLVSAWMWLGVIFAFTMDVLMMFIVLKIWVFMQDRFMDINHSPGIWDRMDCSTIRLDINTWNPLRHTMTVIEIGAMDRILLWKWAIIESMIDQLKSITQIERSCHCSAATLLVVPLYGLIPYARYLRNHCSVGSRWLVCLTDQN